jgi:VWA domain-containing protein/aerotolerance regulator-like protein
VRFQVALGLLVGLLVVAPLLAHLLRRRRADVVPFAPARLVPKASPVARSRARLEDRGLFALRTLAVLGLALLGATPLVRCSRLAVGRSGGASVGLVLVVDDSMSMQARLGQQTRLARALSGAREVLGSAREGDGVAVVAAGAPARVVLAATTELAAAERALASLAPTDRPTDLDGALALATSLAKSMPQADRRVVVLSDLADGRSDASPFGDGAQVPVWVPLPELQGRAPDCGVVRALRRGPTVRVRVACGLDADAEGRAVEVLAGAQVVGSRPLDRKASSDLELTIAEAADPSAPLRARLTGSDAIAADDEAPVALLGGPSAVAVVSDASQAGVETGGPPPIEQVLGAIDETLNVRPLPVVPDQVEDLAAFSAVFLDDPPGLTPEARAAFRTWLDKGGVGVLLLGPRAGGAILGATFDPFVPGPVRWVDKAPPGADPASAFSLPPQGIDELAPKGRALAEARAAEGATVLARWADGAPLVMVRPVGRGLACVVTLPGSAEISDFPLRPAFVGLVDDMLEAAKAHGTDRRVTVGMAWTLPAGDAPRVRGPDGQPVALRDDGGGRRLLPEHAGLYEITQGAQAEARIAEIAESEVDLRPRAAAPAAANEALGTSRASVDVSSYVAFLLLVVIAGEAALRLVQWRREAEP